MPVVDEFRALVNGPDEAIPRDTACLLIASCGRAGADPEAIVGAGRRLLDDLAAGCDDPSLDAVRDHLFGSLGFVGNRRQYDDPRNSYLDEVLTRRTGIPITLAVVVLEVGRRLGLDLWGVGMPGHFLVGAPGGIYVDAFDHGRLLDENGCRTRFNEVAGRDAPWSPHLLAPVGRRDVLARMLANLRTLFAASRDLANLDWVLELRLAVPGVPGRERAERALVLAALGRYGEAAGELERLARTEDDGRGGFPGAATRHPSGAGPPAPETAAELRARAARLRARLN